MPLNQFETLLKSLKAENLSEFENLLNNFTETQQFISHESKTNDKLIEDFEGQYYSKLSEYLSVMRFDDFSLLLNYSDKLGIFIDVKKIPFRFKIISDLHMEGIRQGLVGRILQIIRFYNKYNLFERDFSKKEKELIENIRRNDILLISNLNDLFGHVSDSLIFYACKILPYDIYLFFVDRPKSFIDNDDQLDYRYSIEFLKYWTDGYTMYGLSVRNLGTIENFIKDFESALKSRKFEDKRKFIDFNIRYPYRMSENRIFRRLKKHFVSPENILKNKESILERNNYNFYSLSMVLIGGLGPEGLGFTYSTPRGEVIEICTDQKETEAIIIKFKQYLKRKFLGKLEDELISLGIEGNIRKRIISYLKKILKPKDLINYYYKDTILRKTKEFLLQIDEFQYRYQEALEEIMEKISIAVSIILRRIKLKDQFITRMDLVAEGKVKSEDIAKLTEKIYYHDEHTIICFACWNRIDKNTEICPRCKCSRGKTHYDILRERIFFQNEIDWFFRDYSEEIDKV